MEILPLARDALTDWTFQRIHHVKQTHHSRGVGQVNCAAHQVTHIKVIQSEIGSCLPRIQALAYDCSLFIGSEGYASIFFHIALTSLFFRSLSISLATSVVSSRGARIVSFDDIY